ncbi:MAG: hypothetical protein KKB02_06175, partial [Alphaproteobacteria bacterium]|nr:hypothetical protein [Alphaproteobacteria bacterium]
GAMFTVVGAVVMNNSVELIAGTRTDPRLAVVALAGTFGGPIAAIISTIALAALRLYYGGVGAVPGALTVVAVGLTAIAIAAWWTRGTGRRMNTTYLWVQALAPAIVSPIVLFFSTPVPLPVLLISLALFVPVNIFVVWIMGIYFLREDERRTAVAAYAEAEARITGIANNAPSALFQFENTANAQPVFTYISDASWRILGITAAEMLADATPFLGRLDQNARDELSQMIAKSHAAPQAFSIEAQYQRADGTQTWIVIAADVRRKFPGKLIWNGTITDIANQKNAEKAKDEFISVVSHELRTPLTSIRGSLSLIINGSAGVLPGKATQMLAIANRNSERLVVLINDLLEVQKFTAGKMRISKTRESLRAMMEQAFSSGRNYAPDKDIRFTLIDDAPSAAVMVDADRFHQSLVNLLSNAVKFTPAGSAITMRCNWHTTGVRISVSDQGPGISDEFRDRIFSQFQQANATVTRDVGGTGLGLYITRAIIEAMDGQISFDSVPGEGATFHIDLPLASAIPYAADKVQPPRHQVAVRRLLICSSDDSIIMSTRLALEEIGVSTDIAPDADTARVLMQTREYVTCIVDAVAATDHAALRNLEAAANLMRTPVVILNENATVETRSMVMAAAGAATSVADCLNAEILRAAIAGLTKQTNQGLSKVLYVEDDLSLQEIIGQSIGDTAVTTCAGTVAEARARLEAERFDLVLLDQLLPDGRGLDVIDDIPLETSIVLYSAFDISPESSDRVERSLTKSVDSEMTVIEVVLSILARRHHYPDSAVAPERVSQGVN